MYDPIYIFLKHNNVQKKVKLLFLLFPITYIYKAIYYKGSLLQFKI